MAFDLTARFRLQDNFSAPMRRIARSMQQMDRVAQSASNNGDQLSRTLAGTSRASRTMTASQTQLRNAINRNDSATSQLSASQSRLHHNMQSASSSAQQLHRNVSRSSTSFSTIGRSAGSFIRNIGGMTTAMLGLAGAYATVQGAEKVFRSTIGEAAKYEQSSVVISAMLNDKQLGKDYMKLVDRFAVDSPIMDSQSMLANSKSFLTQSKDMKQLEKMWSLAERMAAIDPMQGVEGSVFALRELFSGDAISMVRRFEMPKAVMNEIKKMDLPKQLEALDEYFNSIGMTQKLVDEMGGTTLGVWAQIKESANVVLRTMGMPALMKVKDFLNEIKSGMASVSDVMKNRNFFTPEEFKRNLDRAMKIESFKETGGKILESVISGFVSAAKGIGSWISSIQNNPDFQKQTTLFGQVKFVIDDVYQRFLDWLNDGGRNKIIKTTADLMQIVIAGVQASSEAILPVAVTVGSAIGTGILQGVKQSLSESWLARLIKDPVGFAVNESLNLLPGDKKFNVFGYQTEIDRQKEIAEMDGKHGPLQYSKNLPKKNGGLNYVPYDGYAASLHRGEMILPRGEADNYRQGTQSKSEGKGDVTIHIANMQVREEADIDRIGRALVRRLAQAGNNMA